MRFTKLFQRGIFSTRKYYTKVLLSFIIMAFLIVLSTSLVFSSMYMNTIYKQLSIDSVNDMEKLTSEFDNVFKQFKDTNIYLNQVPDINAFLYSYSIDDYMTLNRADMISRQIKNLNSYIHSIMLYNKDVKYTLMSGNLNIDRDQFTSGALKSPDAKSSLNMVISSVSDDSTRNNQKEKTISILFNDSDKKNISSDSTIVMTVDRAELEKKLLGKADGTTIVTDSSGQVLFSSDPSQNNPVGQQAYFSRITASENKPGSFKINIDNNNKIVSYAKSVQTGFYIINILNTDNYTGIILKNEITVLSISVGILLVFLLAGYFISRNIYSPIKKVADQFSGSKYVDPKDTHYAEIAAISEVFNNALKQIDELETRSDDNNLKLKEEFLRRLLRGNISEETILSEAGLYKFDIEFSNLIMCCIRIDNHANIGWNKKLAYESTITSIFPEVLNKAFKYEVVNMYEGEFALLINFRNTSENSLNLVIEAMDTIRDITKRTLQLTLSIGISGVSNSIPECNGCYAKAVELVKHRFILGGDHTIYQRLLDDIITTNVNYPDEMNDKLLKAIRMNKKEDFVNNLRDIIEFLKGYPYSKSISMLFQVISECIKTIDQTSQQDSKKYYLGLDDINTIIGSLETLEQAMEWLINIFDNYQEMMDKINLLKNDKHYKLVERMQAYIRENYRDCNINVESLADIAGYTSYYFSKVFKDITGLAVIDYIRQVRINTAKELLCVDEIKISDIPCMVGFSNPSYFYSIFKKDVGLTPSAYKEYILSKNKSK